MLIELKQERVRHKQKSIREGKRKICTIGRKRQNSRRQEKEQRTKQKNKGQNGKKETEEKERNRD